MNEALSDNEKMKIRREEAFRLEIRKALTAAEPAGDSGKLSKLWEFLNSTFGIWLLSSVLLAGGVHWYEERRADLRKDEIVKKQAAEDARKNKEVYERVTLEISFRFSSTMEKLKSISKKFVNRTDAEQHELVVEAFYPLYRHADDNNPSLYPEYKAYSGLALIAELARHAGKTERETLKTILANTSGYINENIMDKEFPAKPADKIAADLVQRMRYIRWENGFPYTSCSPITPFC